MDISFNKPQMRHVSRHIVSVLRNGHSGNLERVNHRLLLPAAGLAHQSNVFWLGPAVRLGAPGVGHLSRLRQTGATGTGWGDFRRRVARKPP